MSRSRKRKMCGGITTASSEKQNKKIWHKSFRTVNKTILKYYEADCEVNLKTVKEMSNPREMDKDGKYIYTTELEIRAFLDLVINEIFGTKTDSSDINRLGFPAIKIYREFCFYLKKKNIRQISDVIKNNFIKYYMNKEKRK